MKLNNEKWVADYKQAFKELGQKGCGPADGIVCILATLRYLKRGLTEDAVAKVDVEKGFAELFKDCYEGKPQGFASNASAAMKAAKIEAGLDLDLGTIKP